MRDDGCCHWELDGRRVDHTHHVARAGRFDHREEWTIRSVLRVQLDDLCGSVRVRLRERVCGSVRVRLRERVCGSGEVGVGLEDSSTWQWPRTCLLLLGP